MEFSTWRPELQIYFRLQFSDGTRLEMLKSICKPNFYISNNG